MWYIESDHRTKSELLVQASIFKKMWITSLINISCDTIHSILSKSSFCCNLQFEQHFNYSCLSIHFVIAQFFNRPLNILPEVTSIPYKSILNGINPFDLLGFWSLIRVLAWIIPQIDLRHNLVSVANFLGNWIVLPLLD